MLIIDAQEWLCQKCSRSTPETIQTVTRLLIHYPNKVQQKDLTHKNMRAPTTFLPSNSVELVMQPSDDNAIHIFECIFATCQVLET